MNSARQICLPLTSSAEDTHASLFPSPGGERARRMTATSGRKLYDCYRVGAKWDNSPLGACLKMLLGTSQWGSTKCFLTWKDSATPAGRSLFRLVPSMPRIDATGYGLWLTPNASVIEAKSSVVKLSGRKPSGPQVGLADQVMAIERGLFPTPTSTHNNAQVRGVNADGKRGTTLAGFARMWPTPRVSDVKGADLTRTENRSGKRHGGNNLATVVVREMYPTPAAQDYRYPNSQESQERHNAGSKRGQQLPNHVGGHLNPEWVEWLMGYPVGWTDCEGSETP